MRLFIALRPPAPVRAMLLDTMEAVAPARWQDDDQLHVTLRFIGDVDPRRAEDVAAALASVHTPVPEVRIAGAGRFTDTLWAGVAPHDALAALHRKVDAACVRAGLPPERRAFLPHVTVARLSRGTGSPGAVEGWLADTAGLSSAPFPLPHLILYESHLGRDGAAYEPVMRWPLDRSDQE